MAKKVIQKDDLADRLERIQNEIKAMAEEMEASNFPRKARILKMLSALFTIIPLIINLVNLAKRGQKA